MVMSNTSLTQDRRWTVAKSNDIIRNTRYSLSVQQQKILLYLISKIKPDDLGNEEYVFDIQEYCRVVGLSTNGAYYPILKQQLKDLRDSSVWIKIDRQEILLAWLNTVIIDEGSGLVRIKFHETVQPYLFELKERYVSYRLSEVLTMRSKFSLRLYELLKSYAFGTDFDNYIDKEIEYTPEEIRKLLDAENYTRYTNLKQRVLLPAITEINKYSEEIHIELHEHKTGSKVSHIIFIISHPRATQVLEARAIKKEKFER